MFPEKRGFGSSSQVQVENSTETLDHMFSQGYVDQATSIIQFGRPAGQQETISSCDQEETFHDFLAHDGHNKSKTKL